MTSALFHAPLREQVETMLDEYRQLLSDCAAGLSEEEARRSLVPSRTTLLGLLKHARFVEQVWFDEAITCRSRGEIGAAAGPDESFILDDSDTIAGVVSDFRAACAESRQRLAELSLDDIVRGNRRGPLPVRWVCLHVLGEHAQHCGHADILREQILAERTPAHGAAGD